MLQDFADKDRSGILNLTAAGLMELPPEIGDLTWLSALLMGENQLTELPPEIGNLVNLAFLNLDDNQLTELPAEIWNLTNLVDWNRHARVFSELVRC